jgi:hypothetical protein
LGQYKALLPQLVVVVICGVALGCYQKWLKLALNSYIKRNAELIFPAPINPEKDLKANSDLSVGNKIQAVITAQDSEKVKQLADDAKNAAKKRFC